ncbi:hypothetical protein [Arthrobacter sp. zg-Y769]|uniref:hypothetical protein n=1 Tax=Arthrobacter sp. zg-Y769 TaxID=2894191 RepID=UPI001E3AF7C3|nr:hypothetical protein [Arthrobacter sp. zg-Y769]MCC9205462.1 hypothetical protein [Arthrobacter sp. zg-Y769]
MDSNTVFVLNEYRAAQAKARREYASAIEYSRLAAQAAVATADNRGFCRMTFNIAELQLELGQVEACFATGKALLATEAINDFPDYQSRARVLITHALQDKGEMSGALAAAREASNVPQEVLPSGSRLNVQHVLVAALAEEGDTEGAWEEAMNLATMVSSEASPRVKGIACWAIGNAAFVSARIEEGLKYHRRAAEDLASVSDVRNWAQFNKASAHFRLAAGLVEEETGECIRRAEVAFEVAGVAEIDRIEMLITRAWWEFESGSASTAERLLRSVERQASDSHPFLQGRSLLLLARCLYSLDRKTEARNCAMQCESIFTKLGADVYASESRELIDTGGEPVA